MAKSNIAQSRASVVAYDMTESRLDALCKAAVKASHEAFPAIQEAGIHALMFFAHHGQPAFMNRLQRELRPEHALAYRGYFIGRLEQMHGKWLSFKPFTLEAGETKGGFTIYRGTPDIPATGGKSTQDISVEARAKIKSLSYADLAKVPWVTPENADRDSTPYTREVFFKSLRAVVNRGIKEGVLKVDDAKKVAVILPDDFKPDYNIRKIEPVNSVAA